LARKGPRPKPTGLRLLHGDRPDRINTSEPVPPAGLPVEPPMSDAARDVWRETAPKLLAMGVLASTDGDALACYCEAVVVARRCSQILGRSDVLIQSVENRPMRNPALAAQRDAMRTVLLYSREFGLTPSARSTLHTPRGFVDQRETLLS